MKVKTIFSYCYAGQLWRPLSTFNYLPLWLLGMSGWIMGWFPELFSPQPTLIPELFPTYGHWIKKNETWLGSGTRKTHYPHKETKIRWLPFFKKRRDVICRRNKAFVYLWLWRQGVGVTGGWRADRQLPFLIVATTRCPRWPVLFNKNITQDLISSRSRTFDDWRSRVARLSSHATGPKNVSCVGGQWSNYPTPFWTRSETSTTAPSWTKAWTYDVGPTSRQKATGDP